MTKSQPDLAFSGHGSIWLLTAHSAAGEAWIEEHIPDDAQTIGAAIAVEARYVDNIANGAMGDGLTVGEF
jgi:hypothetical protein